MLEMLHTGGGGGVATETREKKGKDIKGDID